MVKKINGQYCVVHGHPRKKGSKTDKPMGSVIKCFNNARDAFAMHYAIVMSQKRNKG